MQGGDDDDDDERSKPTPHRTEPVPTVSSIIDKATGTQLSKKNRNYYLGNIIVLTTYKYSSTIQALVGGE